MAARSDKAGAPPGNAASTVAADAVQPTAQKRRRRVPLAISQAAVADVQEPTDGGSPGDVSDLQSDSTAWAIPPELDLSSLVRRNPLGPQHMQPLPANGTAGAAAAGPPEPAAAGAAVPGAAPAALISAAEQRQQLPGLLQLTGTEEEVFKQVLEYVPPQAAAELAEVAEVGGRLPGGCWLHSN